MKAFLFSLSLILLAACNASEKPGGETPEKKSTLQAVPVPAPVSMPSKDTIAAVPQKKTTRQKPGVFKETIDDNYSQNLELRQQDDYVFSYPEDEVPQPPAYPGPVFPKKIYNLVDEDASYNGDLDEFIAQRIIYPQEALKRKIQGTVYVEVVINDIGSIEDARIYVNQQVTDRSLQEEAVRVVKLILPGSWTPAKVDGKPVNAYAIILVKFVLP